MIKTIILERIETSGVNIFKSFSDTLEFYDKNEDEILKKIHDFDILVIKSTIKINKNFFNYAKKLRVIARAGTGLDNIDLKEAKKRGIKIFSVPKGNTVAAAEYIISLIFLMIKKLLLISEMVKKNDFSRHKITLRQLDSMKIGIVGIGNLGIELSKRLQSFGCKLIGFDPYSNKINSFQEYGGISTLNLNFLLKQCDIIILAANLTSQSEYMININNINYIKKGAFFINCARAKLIEQRALISALDKKIIAFAAIDLIEPEPKYIIKKNFYHPLINHPNVFYSPHVAALTDKAQKKISTSLGKKVKNFFSNKKNNI